EDLASSAEDLEVLDEVIGKRIVVVDHEEPRHAGGRVAGARPQSARPASRGGPQRTELLTRGSAHHSNSLSTKISVLRTTCEPLMTAARTNREYTVPSPLRSPWAHASNPVASDPVVRPE